MLEPTNAITCTLENTDKESKYPDNLRPHLPPLKSCVLMHLVTIQQQFKSRCDGPICLPKSEPSLDPKCHLQSCTTLRAMAPLRHVFLLGIRKMDGYGWQIFAPSTSTQQIPRPLEPNHPFLVLGCFLDLFLNAQ